VEKEAVTVLVEFVPWKDFLEGWRDVGSRLYASRSLPVPRGGGREYCKQ
jgi:hypothetical protein